MKERREKILRPVSGFVVLTVILIGFAYSLYLFIVGAVIDNVLMIMIGTLLSCLILPVSLSGFKIIHPNEAGVYTLFGRYYGTIYDEGFYWIMPFSTVYNNSVTPTINTDEKQNVQFTGISKKVSLKAITLDNQKQKVNDFEGNPIEIGVVVIWKVSNATKAVFEVDDYKKYISTQTDASIRHVARQYPYDLSEAGDEKSLRASSQEVANELRKDLQSRVEFAGIEVMEARIAHLAYAQVIAAAMLQRQQAAAIIAARQKIVEGAVGMVEMALNKLSEKEIVELDAERKSQMVSNLLVVLCGNKDAQPIVNSGSIY